MASTQQLDALEELFSELENEHEIRFKVNKLDSLIRLITPTHPDQSLEYLAKGLALAKEHSLEKAQAKLLQT